MASNKTILAKQGFMMKILFISHYFDPEPLLAGMPFAKELVRRGHEVQVLTGFPHYPGGKVYDGYKLRLFQREVMDGIKINRCWVYPSHDRSSVKRFMTYVSLGFTGALLGPLVVDKADVAFVYSPPATIWLPAAAIRLWRQIPFVYNIQDMWPDALASSTMVKNSISLKVAHKVCHYFYRKADRIVAQSNGFKDILVERGVPESQIDVIYNWCDDATIKPVDYDEKLARELGMHGKFNILFAGGMGKGQALLSIIETANIIKDELPDVQFVFLGSGVEKELLENRTKELNLSNVRFLRRCPPSEVGKYMSLAQVMLVHLKDNLIHEITVPSKIQAYMNVGKPILIGAAGNAADLVVRAGAGIKCQPEEPVKIAQSVRKLYNMPKEQLQAMGCAGKSYYDTELSIKVGTHRYEDVFLKTIEQFKK
jgi:colanic acid biosynthesis glycosyl transferase WcaI